MELLSNGYGLIPKSVMNSKVISRMAKLVYSYLASTANATSRVCYAGANLIMDHLDLNKDTFYRCVKELEKYGLLIRRQERTKGKFYRVVFILPLEVELSTAPEGAPCPGASDTVKPDTNSTLVSTVPSTPSEFNNTPLPPKDEARSQDHTECHTSHTSRPEPGPEAPAHRRPSPAPRPASPVQQQINPVLLLMQKRRDSDSTNGPVRLPASAWAELRRTGQLHDLFPWMNLASPEHDEAPAPAAHKPVAACRSGAHKPRMSATDHKSPRRHRSQQPSLKSPEMPPEALQPVPMRNRP